MKALASFSYASLVLGLNLFAQTASDLNEGSSISFDGSTQSGTFSWYGHEDRTYFVEQTDDLLDEWTYAPLIEPGQDQAVSWNFSSTSDRLFLRLRYTERLTIDHDNEDYDQDKVSNIDELFQETSPFLALDTNNNEVPDDWEVKWFGDLDTVTLGSSYADGDAFPDALEYQMGTDPTQLTELSVILMSGDNQIVSPDAMTEAALLVRVEDAAGKAIPNAPVTFTVSSGADSLAWVVAGSQPAYRAPISDTEDATDTLVLSTDRNGLAQLDYQAHALAPSIAGDNLTVRCYVTEAVSYHDFIITANRAPTDIEFEDPSDSSALTSIDLPDTTAAGTVLADLDFLDADSMASGSFELGNYTGLFTAVFENGKWQLRTAADTDFYELQGTQYDLDVIVADGHGGSYTETIQITVTDADTGDSPILAAPTASQAGGEFQSQVSLTLDNSNDRGLIFYTLDGSDPKINGQLYTSGTSIVLASGFQADDFKRIQLRAVVRDNGIDDSNELDQTYTFKPSGVSQVVYIRANQSAYPNEMILTTSTAGSIPKRSLGKGWIIGDSFIPDLSQPAQDVYLNYYDPDNGNIFLIGDERFILTVTRPSKRWQRLYMGKGWVGKPGGDNLISLESEGNFTGEFIPDPDTAPPQLYAGLKRFTVRSDHDRQSYITQFAVTAIPANSYPSWELSSTDYIDLGQGYIQNPVGMIEDLKFEPDHDAASQPVYFGTAVFEHKDINVSDVITWAYSYNASDISDDTANYRGRIQLSDGWISGVGGATVGADNYRPDFNKPAQPIYGGLKWVTKNTGNVYEYNVGLFGDDLKANGWIACSVNAFSSTYRGHDLGTGWTTGPFSHQPYVDPNGFAGNPPSDGLAYHRYDTNQSFGNFMDYLYATENSSDYEFSAPGWYYRAKGRTVDMFNLGDAEDFKAKGHEADFFLSSLDPVFGQDSDQDGIADGFEIFSYHTDPYRADSDGDLIPDGFELAEGLDPLLKNDPLAEGYIQDVALLGQGLSLPDDPGAVDPQVVQVNSGFGFDKSLARPPQVVTGSRYRKIGLNGFPLPDEQPQAEDEEDQEKEESYIDAFDLTLNHSVTDVYVPLPGSSDLALQVRRNFSGAIWDSDNGLRPGERWDRPFGAGWSSNLSCFLKTIANFDGNGDVEYFEYEVQDESGVSHRFLSREHGGQLYFYAIPSSRSQQDALLNTLTFDGTRFTFTKKYGTTIVFEAEDVDQPSSRLDRNGSSIIWFQQNEFFRAETITDRHGNQLVFDYEYPASDNDNARLVPQTITYNGRGGATQQISIDADRYRVHSVTDPRGHTIYYSYGDLTGGVADSYTENYNVPVLDTVEFALSTLPKSSPGYNSEISSYTYELVAEMDYSFSGLSNRMSHLNLTGITDPNQNSYRFAYDFNRTNRISGATDDDGNTAWYLKNGYPRQVVRVDLPGSGGSARFKHCGLSQFVHEFSSNQGGQWDDYLAGYRATLAIDTENNAHIYRFGDPTVEALDDPYLKPYEDPRMMYFLSMELSHYEGASVTLTPPALTEGTAGQPATFALGGVQLATEGNTTLLGTETFTFDLPSGLQLATVTDFSGNVTEYLYETDFPENANSLYPFVLHPDINVNPYLNSTVGFGSKLPEPTKKIMRNARWNGSAWEDVTEVYTYGSDPDNVWFLMDSVVDGRGNKTVYDIDANGNRSSESIYAASDLENPVQQTTTLFGDADFPSVPTRRTVVDLDSNGQDLNTYYTLDDLGRVQLEAVDVNFEGAANHPNALVTATVYDANSNRTDLVDPNTAAAFTGDLSDPADIRTGATLSFTYDARNRLTATQHPQTLHPVTDAVVNPAASEQRLYDKRGNRVGEIDLNGHITVNQYDGLNRKVRSIRVMGQGSGLNAAEPETFRSYSPAPEDLVTRMGYNRLGSMVFTEDPEQSRSFLFYDGLQRLVRSLDAEGNEATFAYDPAMNTGSGAFQRDRFKPTTSVDTRGYKTAVDYDPEGRPLLEIIQYAKGSPENYRVTSKRYDAAGNATHETVYKDFSYSGDFSQIAANFRANVPIEAQLTQTDYDALNRPTQRTRPDTAVETFTYTSTGLLTLERLYHPGADPSSAAPFREQRHYYDGAGRVLASRSLPIAPEVEGEITWVITGQRYDANGNVTEVIDPRNVRYGDIGTVDFNPSQVQTSPFGLNFEAVYDSRNRPVMQLEPRSEDLTRTLRNSDGSQSIETLDDTRPYSLTEYDQQGNVTVQTDAFGHETVTLYDAADRPTHEFTPSVPVLDPFDAGQSGVQLAHLVKQHVIDGNGNILQTRSGIAAPAGLSGQSQYLTPPDAHDAGGNTVLPYVATPTRPTASTAVTWLRTDVTNVYDALNRLERTTDGQGITVVNEYDAAGNRTAMTDGKSQRTEFEYDGLNRNTLIRHPDSSEKTFAFNALTQTGRSDEEGQVTAYTYDDLNRLKTVDYADDSVTDREYFYDPEGNILAVTEAPADSSRMTNVAYAYDAASRLVKECLGASHAAVIDGSSVAAGQLADGIGSDGITHQYEYDLAGNRTRIDYGADGLTVLSEYDLLNRAQTIDEDVDGDGNFTVGTDRRTRYVYDLRGAIIRKETADGLVIDHAYDALNRVHQITGPKDDYGVERYRYNQFYDFAQNVARVDETYPSFLSKLHDRTITNGYDMADRLLTETISTDGKLVTTTYTYDAAHNRVSKLLTEDDGSTVTTVEDISYVLNNQLNQVDSYTDSVNSETVSLTYDLNGARTTRTEGSKVTTYGYDFENRLVSLSISDSPLPTESYAYAYDYRTRRVIRDESQAGGSKTFVIYGDGLTVQEWNAQTAS